MGNKKGKKLWRKTIDTQEVRLVLLSVCLQSILISVEDADLCVVQIEDALENSSREARQGPAVESIPDNELFFIDEVATGRVADNDVPSFELCMDNTLCIHPAEICRVKIQQSQ